MIRHPQPLDDRNAADVLGICGAMLRQAGLLNEGPPQ